MKQPRSNSRKHDTHQDPNDSFERGFRRQENEKARVYIRKPCSEDTHFSANRELFRGTIKNISQGGIYIQTQERFVVGQEVVVAVPFGEANEDVKRNGKIVWQDRSGIAIQFMRSDQPRPRR